MEVIVAFLAVMKTGAAYVPLDIDYPQDRLQWIVEDSAMHLLVTSSGLRQRFAGVEHCVELDLLAIASLPSDAPQVMVHDTNLAYLIYTSGSTGKPKGVAVSHGQIGMHRQAIARLYEMDESTRELLFMSFAFDGAQGVGCRPCRQAAAWWCAVASCGLPSKPGRYCMPSASTLPASHRRICNNWPSSRKPGRKPHRRCASIALAVTRCPMHCSNWSSGPCARSS